MRQYFKSNGKFMLTGEYLVLKGATALALPLNLGQDMCVDTLDDNDGRIYWNASIKSTDIAQRHWFSSIINKNDLKKYYVHKIVMSMR